MDWLILLPLGLMILLGAIAVGVLLWHRPEKVSLIRVNLLWVSTLVAVLTLTFGYRLMDLLQARDNGASASTLEIVLSSLVGVGIGGLIAIAGQLVQDSSQGAKDNESSSRDNGSK